MALTPIAATPEFTAVKPILEKAIKRATSIEKWATVEQEDFKEPPSRLPLLSEQEEQKRYDYQKAAALKNLIVGAIPQLPIPGAGLFTGMNAAKGGGLLATLLGLGKLLMSNRKLGADKKKIAEERDEHRAAADDLESAISEVREAAGNGGLDTDKFRAIMEPKKAGRRHHARRKVQFVEGLV